MYISQSPNRFTIRSIQQVKLGIALIFILSGAFLGLNALHFSTIKPSDLWFFVLAIPASLLLLDVHYTYVTLDKLGECKIVFKTLRKTETVSFTAADIKGVRKKEYTGIGNGSRGPNDFLQLRIKGHGLVDIASTRQSTLWARTVRPYRRESEKIAEFLGIPLEIKKINLLKEFAENPKQDESL